MLCAEPREHKQFRLGTGPGGSVTGVTEKYVLVGLENLRGVYRMYMVGDGKPFLLN